MDSWCNVIIPMAGIGSRFKEYGFQLDKYLLPMDLGLAPMIEKAVVSLGLPSHTTRFFFIVRNDASKEHMLGEKLQSICDIHGYDCHVITVDTVTDGPATSAFSAKSVFDSIPGCNDQPLIISNSDQVLDWSFAEFIRTCADYDGCVLTYHPNYPLLVGSPDKHSFVRVGMHGNVVEVREKIALSNEALVGVHYFKSASLFWEAYEYMKSKDMRAPNGEFYVSLAYQALLENNHTVGKYLLNQPYRFHPVGEPNDYFAYLHDHGGMFIHSHKVRDLEPLFTNAIATVTFHSIRHHEASDRGKRICVNLDAEPLFGYGCHSTLVIEDPRFEGQHLEFQDYVRGWIIGNFYPAVLRVNDYEVGILTHKKDEQWDYHYHQSMIEINLLVRGRMMINNKVLETGDVFTFVPNQLACPKFTSDCLVVCIKCPSVVGDKKIV